MQTEHLDHPWAVLTDCSVSSHQGQARVMMLRLALWGTSLSGVEVNMMQQI